MRPPDQLAQARLAAGCLAVPSPGTDVCRICRSGTAAGYTVCLTCRRLAERLGYALAPITPMALVTAHTSLYRALRQYKSGEPGVARHQCRALASLLAAFLERHLPCIAPDGVDMVAVVPSGARPPPHPLQAVLDQVAHDVAGLPAASPLLHAGPGSLGQERSATTYSARYRCAPSVAGRRVLLVDDTYTTGAHLQSAALALRAAGAGALSLLVIGRYETGHSTASRATMSRASQRRWSLASCAWCATTSPASTTGASPAQAPAGAHHRPLAPCRRSGGQRCEIGGAGPPGDGDGEGGQHLTDRFSYPRPKCTGNDTVRDPRRYARAGAPTAYQQRGANG